MVYYGAAKITPAESELPSGQPISNQGAIMTSTKREVWLPFLFTAV